MPFSPVLAGTTSGGVFLLRCPKCRSTSAAHDFQIDRLSKLIRCGNPACLTPGKDKEFIPALQDAESDKMKKAEARKR